jgi:hypothetical protein
MLNPEDHNLNSEPRFDISGAPTQPDTPYLRNAGGMADEVNGQAAGEAASPSVEAWDDGLPVPDGEPIDPPPPQGVRGRVPHVPPGRARLGSPDDDSDNLSRSRRDIELDKILADALWTGPEFQMAVHMSRPERETFHDDIKALTEREDAEIGDHQENLYRVQTIPEDVLARHEITYSVEIFSIQSKELSEGEAEPIVYAIESSHLILENQITEQKFVFFVRTTDGHGVEVEEDSEFSNAPEDYRPKPLTLKELRQIGKAITDMLRGPQ